MIENKIKYDCVLCQNQDKAECEFKDTCKSRFQKELKTYESWHKTNVDFNKFIKTGDKIDKDLFDYFLNILPPIELNANKITSYGFQVSEAYSDGIDEEDKCRALYSTFGKINGEYYWLGFNFKREVNSKYKIVEYVTF